MKNKNKQAKGVKEPSKEDQRRSVLESSQSIRTVKFEKVAHISEMIGHPYYSTECANYAMEVLWDKVNLELIYKRLDKITKPASATKTVDMCFAQT